MPRRPKEDTGEIHAAPTARAGDNGYDGAAMMAFITAIEDTEAAIDEIMDAAKADALPHREEITKIKKEAAEAGFAKKEFAAVLRRRRRLREADNAAGGLDDSQKRRYATITPPSRRLEPCEIFLQAGKAGSELEAVARDAAVLASLAEKVKFNRDNKFDIQLTGGLIAERRLAEIFAAKKIEKIELKTETWQWEQTGNICIEYRQNGKPSGIAVTEADYWIHELRRDDRTLCYLMFPTERLKELARKAYAAGRFREGGGDGGRFCNVLIPLSEILK